MMTAAGRLGILISGRGSNLQAIIDAIAAGRLSATIAVVVSNRAEAGGLECARAAGIDARFLNPSDHADRSAYDRALAVLLKSQGVDLVCLAGYMRRVGAPLLDAFPNRILNIHPSLLPAFPGLDAQRQALEHGVRVTGATVHLVTAALDAGPIVAQAAVPVLDHDTVETLSARVLVEEHRLYPEAIQIVLDGRWLIEGRRFVSSPQPPAPSPQPQVMNEMIGSLLTLVPFAAGDTFRIVEVGPGESALTAALRDRFPRATIVNTGAAAVDSLAWWDLMFGAGLIVSLQQLQPLNDAKKQYLFNAAADRLSEQGALLIAEELPPFTLLHHLVWLKHAGFSNVDCFWRSGAHAVLGGIRPAGASAPPLRADN
jgi:phosphoribosylglycinamide formyltransferase-1